MCGICGIAGKIIKEEGLASVRKMNDAMSHRGPDDASEWGEDGFAFGMRRLSIIDLEGGAQPIWTEAGTGIIQNGEIYNYRQLREQLAGNGCVLKTHSDTEVIPHLYELYGDGCVNRLDGMFGFCVYDPAGGKIFLARDRLGIKPLYYGALNGKFYFASEIKAILAAADARPAVNRVAIDHYLTLRYVPSPMTVWEGIYKLEPGHSLTYNLKNGEYEIMRYWALSFEAGEFDAKRDYAGEFEKLFLEAVDSHLVASDVPVGVLLSGGLDSSAVSAAAVEKGHRNFHTFSIGFEDGGQFSELEYARAVAKSIGSRHFDVTIGKKEFLEFIPELVRATDEPLADLASIPLYYVSKLAREHVKTCLCGEGSDELLAGYNMDAASVTFDKLARLSGLAPSAVLKALAALAPGGKAVNVKALAEAGISGYLKSICSHMTYYWTAEEKASLWKDAPNCVSTESLIRSWYDEVKSPLPLDQLQQVYCKSWLVEDLLMKADRMSMAVSLELRVPFLHRQLVEWAMRLPIKWRTGGGGAAYTSKRILREFSKKRIPEEIINRPKRGFPVPAYEWLKGDTGSDAVNTLLDSDSFIFGLFDTVEVKRKLDSARAGDEHSAHKVWIMLILEHWGRRWMTGL